MPGASENKFICDYSRIQFLNILSRVNISRRTLSSWIQSEIYVRKIPIVLLPSYILK